MLRIIGVQKSEQAKEEFILLQNQGSLRVNLRGHVILSETAIDQGLAGAAHVFAEEAMILPGAYVLLMTGCGESRWARTKEQSLIYYTFMNRVHSVWFETDGPLHILNRQHTHAERPAPSVLLR